MSHPFIKPGSSQLHRTFLTQVLQRATNTDINAVHQPDAFFVAKKPKK